MYRDSWVTRNKSCNITSSFGSVKAGFVASLPLIASYVLLDIDSTAPIWKGSGVPVLSSKNNHDQYNLSQSYHWVITGKFAKIFLLISTNINVNLLN